LLVWPCPACRLSPLRLVPDTLRKGETKESKAEQSHPAWEPEWIDGRFTCMMDCGHCGNVVGAAGTFRVKDDCYVDPIEGESGDYEAYYKIKAANSNAKVPNELPVKNEIEDGCKFLRRMIVVAILPSQLDKEFSNDGCGDHANKPENCFEGPALNCLRRKRWG